MDKLISAVCAAALLAAALGGCMPEEQLDNWVERFVNAVDPDAESRAAQQASVNAEAESRQSSYGGYGYLSLNTDSERELYAKIDIFADRLVSEEFSLENKDGISGSVSKVIEIYKNDHPEVFWFDAHNTYTYRTQGDTLFLELAFSADGDELKEQKEKFALAVEKALEYAPADASDYEKELFVNDYIIQSCEYDKEAEESDDVVGHVQNAYGALAEGKAVCEGYTRAFQLLCQKLNLDCVVINGQCSGEETENRFNGNHIWNCVRLDDGWYHVDSTWNDFVTDDEEYTVTDVETHCYFNVTTERILQDHTISPLYGGSGYDETVDFWYNDFVPECTSTVYNYFNYSIPSISDLDDSSALVSRLTEAAADGKDTFTFQLDSSLNFDNSVDELINRYAYEWIEQANYVNDGNHQISEECQIYSYKTYGVVAFILN